MEIVRSEQPWSGATPENIAAAILMRRGIRFRPSVSPTLDDILPPCRVSRCSKTGDLTVWQGSEDIPGTIGEPIIKPSTLKRTYTREELDAAVKLERERVAWLASNAMQSLIDAIKNGSQPDRTE